MTLDEVARQLRDWRVAAGSPSFADLARRVGELRAAESQEPRHAAPGRVTVYDCFRDGRSRIDVELVTDLAAVLGIEGAELAAWRERCTEAMRPPATSGLVTATTTWPVLVEPVVETIADDHTEHRVLFAGIGGSGKTQAAARRLAALRTEGVIDGVLTLRIDGPEAALPALLHTGAHELGVRLPEEPVAATKRLLEVVARRRMALFVDDVAEAEQLAPIVSAHDDLPLLATSRRALDVAGLHRIDLPPWRPGVVAAYLSRVVGSARTDAEPDALSALAELTGGLPLVAALVAARVRATPHWSLADHVTALRERRAGDRLEDAVAASMEATHAALSTEARSLLTLLASGPRAGVTDDTLRASTEVEIGPCLAELERAYLLHRADQRHRLHDIARAYARGRALDEDPPRVRAARSDRLIDRLCAEAWGVARVLAPSDLEAQRFDRTPAAVPAPHTWLAADLPGALEIVRDARSRRPAAVMELSEAVATSLERTGLSRLSDQLHSLAREVAVASDDPVGEARARCALAISALRRDETDAPLEEITALATRSGDTWTLARLGNLRGILAMRAGDAPAGLRWFREAHDLALGDGHHALAPAIAGNLAIGLAYAGDLDGALSWNEDTLAGALRVENRGLAATTWSNMSETQRMLGRYDDAVASAEQAISFASDTGDKLALTHAMKNLGASLTRCGQPAEAVRWLERAESTAADIGLVEVQATLHTGIGEALLAAGDSARAAARFHAALDCHSDSPIDPATALHRLGQLAAEADPCRARRLFDQALARLGDGFEQVAAAIRTDRDALA